MEKNLRKCYEKLDLPFSSTIEEVEARKNALIKILNSNDVENKTTKEKEIALVESSANAICENIKINGIPKETHEFETSNDSIWTLFVLLLFSILACCFSFYIFL